MSTANLCFLAVSKLFLFVLGFGEALIVVFCSNQFWLMGRDLSEGCCSLEWR
jgi:hypothetical protein